MFTIKHIGNDGETLYEGREPTFLPPVDNGTTGRPGSLSYTNESGALVQLMGGEAYVMNDLGKTVAHYSIDGAPRRPHAV